MHQITGTYPSLYPPLNEDNAICSPLRGAGGERNGGDFSFTIPQNWQELEPLQTAYILETLSYAKADAHTLKTSIMVLVCGPKNFQTLANMADEDRYTIYGLIDWVFTTRPAAINKFQSLKINKKKYIAPSNTLGNLCFGEWCFAYEFYSAFHKYNDQQYLNKLIATLYRQPLAGVTSESDNYNGDLRTPFNENQIENTAKGVSGIPANIKNTILTWFTSAMLDVMEKRPHVFPKPIPKDEDAEENTIAEEPTHRTWLTVFRELIGPKFGTSEQLKHTNAKFVLDYLEEQHINYEEAIKNL